jgi:hypothetical protein
MKRLADFFPELLTENKKALNSDVAELIEQLDEILERNAEHNKQDQVDSTQ